MILAYHRINPWYKKDALSVSPEQFERQLRYTLKRFYPISPSVLPAIKPNDFLITFDDGYADNLWYAIPVLKKLGIVPIIFLTVNYIGTDYIFNRYRDKEKDRFLTWNEVKKMSDEGVVFGSHSLSHPHLPDLSDSQLWIEVDDSKKMIEDKTGKPVDFFCYPYGDFDERVIEKVQLAGYKNAFVTPPKGKKIKESNYTLLRTGVYGHNNFLAFRVKIWKNYIREKRS